MNLVKIGTDIKGKPVFEGDILELERLFINNNGYKSGIKKERFALEWNDSFQKWQFGLMLFTDISLISEMKKLGSIHDSKNIKLSSKRPLRYKKSNSDSRIF